MRNNLAKRQVGMLVFFVPLIFKIAMLPSFLAKAMAQDAWLGMAILSLAEFTGVFFIVQSLKLGGMEKLKQCIGKGWFLLLTLPLLGVYLVKYVVYTAEAINYVSTFLFYNTQKANLVLLAGVVVGYLALSGVNTMGRLSEVLVWALPCILLVGLSFGEVRLHPEFILPTLAGGAGPLLGGVHRYMMWTFDLSPLLFCKLHDPHPRRPLVLVGGALGFAAVLLFYLAFIMSYGGAAPYVEHAFAAMAAFNVVNTEIGSIDWPTIVLWLGTMVVALALKGYGAAKVGEGLGVPYRAGVMAFTLTATLLCLFVWNDLARGIALGTSWVRYPVVAVDALVPLITFILLKVHARREQAPRTAPPQPLDPLDASGEGRGQDADADNAPGSAPTALDVGEWSGSPAPCPGGNAGEAEGTRKRRAAQGAEAAQGKRSAQVGEGAPETRRAAAEANPDARWEATCAGVAEEEQA